VTGHKVDNVQQKTASNEGMFPMLEVLQLVWQTKAYGSPQTMLRPERSEPGGLEGISPRNARLAPFIVSNEVGPGFRQERMFKRRRFGSQLYGRGAIILMLRG
jgi:hypothetical protein